MVVGEFSVNTLMGTYPVLIEPGCRNQLSQKLQQLGNNTGFVIISDENVASIYKDEINQQLSGLDRAGDWIIIPAGEISKSLENYEIINEKLLEKGFSRTDTIIAVGGGVVIDLAGFVASTYMRGIRWINIPTSLLAQADASIGGKVGIHFSGIKNVLGAFHQPSIVLIDPEFLNTLSDRDFLSGAAEIFKMAILPGGEKFSIWDMNNRDKFLAKDMPSVGKVIEEVCRFKSGIIERDEFDRAGRIVLNLGHTLGHALESVNDFKRYTHGEAVCIGVLFISKVALKKGDMIEGDFNKIFDLYLSVARNCPYPEEEWDDLENIITHDKKWDRDSHKWVYPLGIGNISIREFNLQELSPFWNDFRINFTDRCKRDGKNTS